MDARLQNHLHYRTWDIRGDYSHSWKVLAFIINFGFPDVTKPGVCSAEELEVFDYMVGLGLDTYRRDLDCGCIKQFKPDKLHQPRFCRDHDLLFAGRQGHFIWLFTIYLKGF